LVTILVGVAMSSSGMARAAGRGSHCVVRIAQYRFHPATVTEGQHTVLRTVVRNCTDDALTVTLTQFGTEPSPCPVIDPVSRSVTLSPVGTYSNDAPMTAPPCAGDERMTVRVTGPAGHQLAERTAHLTVTPPS
jgi:hypothetical protein